jgi:hypothetical protein
MKKEKTFLENLASFVLYPIMGQVWADEWIYDKKGQYFALALIIIPIIIIGGGIILFNLR